MCFDTKLPVPVYMEGGGYYHTFDSNAATPQCEAPDKANLVLDWNYAESTNPSTTAKIKSNSKKTEEKVIDIPHQFRPNYTVLDSEGDIVEIHTRSVLGAYQYLGQLLHNEVQFENLNLRYADTQDNRLLRLGGSNDSRCFASINYDGEAYCVPNSAANTKRIFSLLRQLVGLLTKPNNQPATPTTRTTPN